MNEEEIDNYRIHSLQDVETGTMVCGVINGRVVQEIKVRRETGCIYLCQNIANGNKPRDKDTLGYKYGWSVGTGSAERLISNSTFVFKYGTDLEVLREELDLEQRERERAMEEERRRLAELEQERKKALLEKNRKEFVKKVLKYLDKVEKSPLKFSQYDTGTAMDIHNEEHVEKIFSLGYFYKDYLKTLEGVDRLVYICIAFAKVCKSRNGDRLETSYGRRRSALDIWRHINDPEITIFHVMTSLYKIADGDSNVRSWFCSTVNRQVFHPGGYPNDQMTHNKDEFGNYYGNWKCAAELYEEYLKKNEPKV